jgi:serine/threonine-protein kinase
MDSPVPQQRQANATEVPAPSEPQVGATVGQYLLVEQLGKGGQGHLFKARCEGRFFVLKFYAAHDSDTTFRRELSILQRVRDAGVVRFFGSGRWPDPRTGSPYLVLEHVEGLTLEAWCRRFNPSAHEAARLFLTLAQTLGRLHAKGIYHRDVKLENLLVRADSGEPVVVDFGVADLAGSTTIVKPGELVGTLPYLSPEAWLYVAAGEEHCAPEAYVYTASDEVWALGVTLYWVLTNQLPFFQRSSRAAVMQEVLLGRVKPPREVNGRVPPALSEVCLGMLARRAPDRYADMAAVAVVLEQVRAQAGADWEVPLFEPKAPEVRTTEVVEGKVRRTPREHEEHLVRQALRQQWQRKAPEAAGAEAASRAAPGQVAPPPMPQARPAVAPPPPGRWRRSLSHVLPTFAGGMVPLRALLVPRRRYLVALGGALLLALAAVGAGAWREGRAVEPRGHKVEAARQALDAGVRAAAPLGPTPPAPVAPVTAPPAGGSSGQPREEAEASHRPAGRVVHGRTAAGRSLRRGPLPHPPSGGHGLPCRLAGGHEECVWYPPPRLRGDKPQRGHPP